MTGVSVKPAHVNAVLGIGLVAVALGAWALDEPFVITLATKVAILALAGAGLNLALGHGGLVSFGHAAFFGIGGYAMGVLASHAQLYEPLLTIGGFAVEGTKSMPVIWLVAIVTSGLAALGIGALSLRTGGLYFIMLTLAFAQMIYYFAISWPAYGGEDGLSIYVRNSFPGLNTLDPIQFFGLCAALLFVVLFGLQKLVHSRFGLVLEAARQAPGRVVALGLEPHRVQLTAFVISGAITGLAGALYADLNRFVSPSMLAWQTSGRNHHLRHSGRHGATVRTAGGGGLVHRAGNVARRYQRVLAVLSRPAAAWRRAVCAGRRHRLAGGGTAFWLNRC